MINIGLVRQAPREMPIVACGTAKYQLQKIKFKPKNKPLETDPKLNLCGKRLYTTTHFRYLGILIDDKLN